MCRTSGFPPALLHLVMAHQLDVPVRQAGTCHVVILITVNKHYYPRLPMGIYRLLFVLFLCPRDFGNGYLGRGI